MRISHEYVQELKDRIDSLTAERDALRADLEQARQLLRQIESATLRRNEVPERFRANTPEGEKDE